MRRASTTPRCGADPLLSLRASALVMPSRRSQRRCASLLSLAMSQTSQSAARLGMASDPGRRMLMFRLVWDSVGRRVAATLARRPNRGSFVERRATSMKRMGALGTH